MKIYEDDNLNTLQIIRNYLLLICDWKYLFIIMSKLEQYKIFIIAMLVFVIVYISYSVFFLTVGRAINRVLKKNGFNKKVMSKE